MIEAILWGLLGGSSLVVGGVLALVVTWSPKVITLVMAFGSGVLISAVAFDLVAEAWPESGGALAAASVAAGTLVFFGADLAISRTGVPRRRRAATDTATTAAMVIVAGAALDGIPESAAIGATLTTSPRRLGSAARGRPVTLIRSQARSRRLLAGSDPPLAVAL